MSSNVPIIKFLFRTEWKVLTEALNLNPIYESVELGSANDLSTYLSSSPGGLIVTSLRDKNDLVQLATFVKQIKKAQNPPYVKIFVINFSHDKQYEKAASKLGILDIIDDKIQTKALRFKLDFMMKSVNAQVKKQQAQNSSPAAVKSLDASKAQDKKVTDNAPVWEPSLDCEDDVWLLKAEQDCKKVLTRWLVKLMGPSPYVAQWVESGTPGVWKFEFKGENVFIYGTGHWYYKGDQKPDFIWSENIWSFTGSSFDLFYKEGDAVHSRLKLKDKVLTIAKNSDYAKTKEQSIAESFDKELVFKKEGMAAAEAEGFEKDQEKYQNLEGKGKTDALKGGPLSGKGSTSQINNDPLSGKGSTSNLSTDPLSMELNPGENNSSTDPLSQKSSSDKKSSFWKGKNEYAEEGKADLAAPGDHEVKTGAELSLENKNKHDKYYKNHNEAEQFEGKDIGHAVKKDGVADNLKGKTSTDEIEGHLTSPDAKKKSAQKEKSPGEMSGKSSTDKLDGHLSSPDAKKEEAKKEKAAAEMSGKSSTDKLAGHLSSPDGKSESAQKDKQPSELNGKGKKATEGSEKSPADKLAELVAKKKAALEGTKYQDQDEEDFEDSGTQKDLQELKDALNSNKKSGAGRKSEGGTDQIGGHYSNHQSPRKSSPQEVESEGKVLPFATAAAAKQAVQEEEEVLPTEIAEAIMEAKITSYLVQDSVKALCRLDDHFDQTIIFITDQHGLESSKTVLLNLNFNYMNKDTNLKFNGNIMQIDSDGEGSNYVTVEISKENVSAFNSFMKLYTTRQNNINLFLKTVKGF